MKVEYLIMVKQGGTFCDSKETFISLLTADSRIDVDDDVIRYRSDDQTDTEFVVKFTLHTDQIPDKEERFFHLTLTSDDDERKDELTSLVESVKQAVQRIKPGMTSTNTLWDDIGRQYAIEAYPLINEVENLMRKLIARFMLVNVGMQWSREALHKDLVDIIEKKSEGDTQMRFMDDLYKTDFIVLSEILFKHYRALSPNELDKIISEAETNTEIDLDEIRKFLSKSNWKKYFADKVKYDGDKLREKWERLYKLRNDVAHNRNITKAQLGEIKGLADEIKQVIEQSIEELDEIELVEEEKQIVVEVYTLSPKNIDEYLALQAVSKWYLENYSAEVLRQASTYKIRFLDLAFLCTDGKRIGVEVKLCHLANVMDILYMTRRNQVPFALELINNDQLDEYHIVLITSGFEGLSTEQINIVLDRVANVTLDSHPATRTILGYLDNDSFVHVMAF